MNRSAAIALMLLISLPGCGRKQEQSPIRESEAQAPPVADTPVPADPVVLTPTADIDRVLWQYTLEKPAEDWVQLAFDASPWASGEGGFGAEGTPGAFVGTVWTNSDIWLRRSFVVTNLNLPPLALVMHHDDDAEVYLNGTLAYRVRGFTQSYREFQISGESRKSLTLGTNLLAVHCHQFGRGQYIDAGLLAREQPKLAPKAMTRIESETLPWNGLVLSPVADQAGVVWKCTTEKPATEWTQPLFDDSAWERHESGFGSGGAPGALVRTEWRTSDLWLRRQFVMTNLDLPSLELLMHHDEDAEVYFNGVLACDGRGFTAGYCEFAISEEGKKALVSGTNLLAVHCRQTFAGQFIDVGVVARDLKRKLPRQEPVESTSNAALEWPCFLGPTHDAVYHGPPLLDKWPTGGPRRIWSKAIGDGRSSPVVGEGRLIVCYRQADDLLVDCLNPQTGETHWSFRDPMAFSDRGRSANGPRPTPALKGGKVFVHNNDGRLTCLNLADGNKLWSRATREELAGNATDLGSVSSPLVMDKAVILQVGGKGSAVVAFASETGQVLWKAFDDLANMSSPVPATLDGKSQVLLVTRAFLRSFDPATGAANWQYATHQQGTHTLFGAAPVVSGNDILVSGWHGLGARVVRVSGGKLERLWVRNDALSADFATPIVFEGNAYGYHGVEGSLSLRCVELATGDVKKEIRFSAGGSPGTLIRCGDCALVQCLNGELLIVWLSPWGMNFRAVARPLSRSSYSYPAVVDGYVYARDRRQIVCLDLRVK